MARPDAFGCKPTFQKASFGRPTTIRIPNHIFVENMKQTVSSGIRMRTQRLQRVLKTLCAR
jgi:hypothetical protein